MDSLIIKRAEQRVRQRIFGGALMFVAALMLANTFGLVKAANNSNANVTFNIDAGALELNNGPTRFRFGNATYGTTGEKTTNAEDEVDFVRVTDYRGTSAAWTLSVNTTGNLTNADGSKQINANRLRLYQDTRGFLTNIENATTSRVTIGVNGVFGDAARTLINTSSSPGIVQYDNGFVNLTYWATDATASYFTTVAFTLT